MLAPDGNRAAIGASFPAGLASGSDLRAGRRRKINMVEAD